MNRPYIKKYKQIGDLSVYIVDGKFIRDRWDDQFTNFAIHERFHFIPVNEAWVDREVGGKKEYNYFVQNILKEKEVVAEGDTIWEAGAEGDKAEKKARRFELRKPIKLKKLDEYANIVIWKVDGDQVRKGLDIDFTQGGHDLVYDFIKPKNGKGEIWLDNYYDGEDRDDIQLHEMRERNKMALGQEYGHGNRVTGAHASASLEEKRARRNPKLLKSLIEKEKEVARIIYEEGTGAIAKKHVKELTECWNKAIRFDGSHEYNVKNSRHKHKRHGRVQSEKSLGGLR